MWEFLRPVDSRFVAEKGISFIHSVLKTSTFIKSGGFLESQPLLEQGEMNDCYYVPSIALLELCLIDPLLEICSKIWDIPVFLLHPGFGFGQ